MIYKGYMIYPVSGHYRVLTPNGNILADVDTYAEGEQEIEEDLKEEK